jgi:hypothetical protein
MAGFPQMYESMFGAGEGYYDVGDAGSVGGIDHGGASHTSFIIWLIVFSGAAIAILGGLKVLGFHFVVKT